MTTDDRFEGARYDNAWRAEYAPEEPPLRELRCQCCGGYAGHGVRGDPEFCEFCRRAGEHKL